LCIYSLISPIFHIDDSEASFGELDPPEINYTKINFPRGHVAITIGARTPFAGHHFLEQEITFLMFEVSEEAG
jgi:hypothetical protein